MQLFVADDVRERLEAECRTRAPDHAPAALVEWLWYARQSASDRTAGLLAEARTRCTALAAAEAAPLLARLDLVAGEVLWLSGHPEQAVVQAARVAQQCRNCGDKIGESDASYLAARALNSQGRLRERDLAFEVAIARAGDAKDARREVFLQAQLARYQGSTDLVELRARYPRCFEDSQASHDPVVRSALDELLGRALHQRDDAATSAQHFTRAFEVQRTTGQDLAAVISALNIADAFNVLNDQDAALEWAQRGLDWARHANWPLALGPALTRVGECLGRIDRPETARDLLLEAISVYEPFQGSRTYAVMQRALAETLVTLGQWDEALALLAQAATQAEATADKDLLLDVRTNQVESLQRAERHQEADSLLTEALALAREQKAAMREAELLALAAHAQSRSGNAAAALDLQNQALQIQQTQPGVVVNPELLDTLADYHAACGQFEQAYRASALASQAYGQSNRVKAHNRATAMQVRMDTERIRADAEQQRQRFEILQRTSATLEHLGAIGQEITAQLNKEKVFESIHRHVHGLLTVDSFSIYLMDADGLGLTSVYDVEAGAHLPSDHVDMDDPTSNTARCVRERSEFLLNFPAGMDDPSHIPGTLRTLSAFFAPLIIGERVLGVMTIQSAREHAYGEQERLIFRTLCAYAAIALDNSVAYNHLREAQEQIVAHEKLAALGSLVAGVAHELNTPIGNALLTASTLSERTREITREIDEGALRKASLTAFIADTEKATVLIGRGLESAASLVQQFKQVAVDRATEQRRPFDLKRTSEDVLATLARTVQKAGHQVEIDIPDDLIIDGYPGPYGQVLTNMINNALVHAFDGRKGGTLQVSASAVRGETVEIRFTDDGLGIGDENLKRVFDPFFTTRLGRGGSGLGLAISYNIATALFGGELSVSSVPGQGTRFIWRLPRTAPERVDSEVAT